MDSLIFSVNATMPIFLLTLLGMVFRRLGWMDLTLADKLNGFSFRVLIPVNLFWDMADMNLSQDWDGGFVLFCFAVTAASIAGIWALSYLWRDRSVRGEFIQASYRSSVSIVGIALIVNMYGNAGVTPLMLLVVAPLYNVMAVVALTVFGAERHSVDRNFLAQTLGDIAKNPIILGILSGTLWSLLRLPMPLILQRTIPQVGNMGTPLALLAMGAMFDIKKVTGKLRPTLAATFIKLVALCALGLPLAVTAGYRGQHLAVILTMLGSATAVASFPMARSMGHEGVITSGTVMLTTLLSAFTLTFWLWLLRSMGLI